MDIGSIAASVAGASTLAAYLNAKFHVTKDVSNLMSVKQGEREYARAVRNGRGNPWFLFTETAKKYPNMSCIWSREGAYTYTQVQGLACQYAHLFLSMGVKPGELVGLYLQNCPEYLFAWLGLWSIGCAPAAINYHLADDALLHCLKISGTRLLLVDNDAECRQRIEAAREILEGELGMELVMMDSVFRSSVSTYPATFPPMEYALDMQGSFPAILIYTSGTTGKPKGCAFTMARFYAGKSPRRHSTGDRDGPDGDRWYCAMPMYHGTGGLSLMFALCTGVRIAIGRKFSVRNFWRDVRDSDSTYIVYVGEAARYLLAAPPSPDDRNHRVRCMYGNGLRPDVWERFRDRFGVAEIMEFFNSTEGMFSLYNHNNGPYTANSVGHHGVLSRLMLRNVFVPVEVDPTTGDIIRDPRTGFATRPPYKQGGEMLVAIPNETSFQGYWHNPEATAKKYIRDVFRTGDLYYRTGDALRREDDGRWYFVDRLGDTFRWKSENVATAEVAEVIGCFPGVQEANVYGVKVPNHEGRAGCAALMLAPETKATFDFKALAAYTRAKLPKYAVPVFLRVIESPVHIGNHKQNKVPLRDEGVDPDKVGTKVSDGMEDRFLWLPPWEEGYIDFNKADWAKLTGGGAKL
ncbi:hypothetical protein N7519_002173 [Penicillium mononematosum]|uniref:uncharacterized protein n=1 Tax=Penicillium mononematosum TaxID=268346 RepID=UPI0025466241|nr:uncharacterized protein N7519_002173 [Penicillium mononematosum]KAJ6187265.1 hypothetical protein N7519_002173 [Penicillium mononematosum]